MHLAVPCSKRSLCAVNFQHVRTGTVCPRDINHTERFVGKFNDRNAVVVNREVAGEIINLGDSALRFTH